MPVETLQDEGFDHLLEYLRRSRGFDFTGYKRASLERRVGKRMQEIRVREYGEYVDYLEVHPEEFEALFNTILINVTGFFRDKPSWDYLQESALPALLARLAPGAPLRIWSAGCATGEEPCTVAIVLAELLGAEAFRERVKIYATDVDEDALGRARLAVYDARAIEDVPPELVPRYFERTDTGFAFRKEFRRQIIYGRHDLIQDAPISRVDLLVCRNVLMYFNAETQARILARFHFALNEHGLLFLGRAETLLSHASTFHPVDLQRRISAKVPRGSLSLRDRLTLAAQHAGAVEELAMIAPQHRLRDLALESAPTAQLVLDAQGNVLLVNERARQLFGIASDDLGRAVQDLRISYRPVELRSLLDQLQHDRRPVLVRDVEHRTPSGEQRWLDLQLCPLFDEDGTLLGTSAAFLDVSASKRLQQDLEQTNHELETAYEELQSTNEELETTNEELQSTVEELETTNEELQSTNEELETMNEELQSTNEELSSINDAMRQRSDELNQVNAFLASVLASLRGAVVVVDDDLRVLVWSDRAVDLWGLRRDEVVGRPFFGIDIGLPLDDLRTAIGRCLAGEEVVTTDLAATNRRGRGITCRVTASPLRGADEGLHGVILLMEEIVT
jgi:two-component system CheB/CheR fusion protein